MPAAARCGSSTIARRARPQTTRSPSGIRVGSHQNASLTKRLKRSGGSNVSRGSALTVPRTVCSPRGTGPLVELGYVVIDVAEVVFETRLADKAVDGVQRLRRVGGQGLVLHQLGSNHSHLPRSHASRSWIGSG